MFSTAGDKLSLNLNEIRKNKTKKGQERKKNK